EFTMIEWYRLQIPFLQLIEEALSLIALFFDLSFPVRWVSYREALKVFAGIDYVHVGNEELLACIDTHHLTPPSDAAHWDKDTLLQFIMSFIVEPQLGADELFVIHDYPATQAALAQVRKTDDEEIAERFEVYFRGIELANGYHELTDPKEQERRLIKENEERVKRGKTPLPLDKDFVQALECGLPDCCGVAVGFDRLMMLRHDKKMLADVLPIR
ncbi:MAG: amino acid--tRNA ligase-related protein, partial [Anaerolineae bacterium]